MLGEQIGEARGKRIVRRVLSSEPPKVEVSFEDAGQMLGIDVSGFGTYTAVVRSDGTLYGDGEGVYITRDGETLAWKGSALGKFTSGGGLSYRGILYYRTASSKLARLNSVAGVFEYDVDEEKGSTHAKVWEWK